MFTTKRELLTDDEQKTDLPAWLEDIKREINLAELVPVNRGSCTQKLKGIFPRMQLD